MQGAGEREVDVGEVDEDGDVGAVAFDGGDELAILAEDVGHVADDFGDAHVSHVLCADDTVEASFFHF